MSETFTRARRLRDLDATRRLLAASVPGGEALAARLRGAGCRASVRDTIGWLLVGRRAREVIAQIVAAAVAASLATSSRPSSTSSAALDGDFPGDPRHRRGAADEPRGAAPRRGAVRARPACCTPTSAGLGVEIMAASDNVLRGGLTPKHVDVARAADGARPDAGSGAGRCGPWIAAAWRASRPDVPDFALTHVVVDPGEARDVDRRRGRDRAGHGGRGDRRRRDSAARSSSRPARPVLITPDEGSAAHRGRRRGLHRAAGR